jgi:cathepsin L
MLKFASALAVVIFAISALLAIIFADAATPKWDKLTPEYTYEQYCKDLGKKIPSDYKEYEKREKLFKTQLREVLAHNADKTQTYKKGINKFSDWTREEFARLNGGRSTYMEDVKAELRAKPFHSVHKKSVKSAPYPIAFDWRDQRPSVISAVKDQGQCGSCWAHGSTETLESHYAIATGQLYVLAQQQITACAPNPNQCGGTGGCQGSIAELAFAYVIQNGGQTEEWQYPYTAYWGTTGTCSIPSQSNVFAKFSSYKTVASNDQDAVLDALTAVGPLAVNVDASQWNNYETGVYSGCNYANNISIDHVVQLVGYGVDYGLNLKYWTIRNSWSASYGENGYIRIIKHDTPQCGWNVNAQDGTACKGQPSTQWVCGQCGVLFDTSYPVPVVPTN